MPCYWPWRWPGAPAATTGNAPPPAATEAPALPAATMVPQRERDGCAVGARRSSCEEQIADSARWGVGRTPRRHRSPSSRRASRLRWPATLPRVSRNRPALLLALLDTATPPSTGRCGRGVTGNPLDRLERQRAEPGTGEAYRAGAIAVLGEDFSASDLGHVARNTLLRLARPHDDLTAPPSKRSYREGETD